MAESLSPDWQFIVYPRSNAAVRTQNGFVVADIFHDLLSGANSDTADLLATGEWNAYTRLAAGLEVENAGFMVFLPDGTVGRKPTQQKGQKVASGFYPLPLRVPQSAQFTPLDGTWKSVPPAVSQGAEGVINVGTEETERCEYDALAKNQPLEYEFTFYGRNGEARPAFYIRLGVNLRIALRQNIAPTLEVTDSPEETGSEEWATFRTMDKFGPFQANGTKIRLRLYHRGERTVWEMNEHALWVMDAVEKQTANNHTPKDVVPRKLEWGGVPVHIEATNLRVRIDRCKLVYSQSQVSRIRRTIPVGQIPNVAFATPYAGGSQPSGTSLQVQPVQVNDDSFTYELILKPSEDGVTSPMASQFIYVRYSRWTDPLRVGGVNVTAAVTSCTLNLAAPPVQAGAEGEIEFDINLLAKFVPGFVETIRDECPIEISGGWRNASGQLISTRDGLFRGYLMGTTGSEEGWNKATLKFQLRDPICRLQGSLAQVDGRCYPLDYEFLNKLKSISSDSGLNGYSNQGVNEAVPLTRRQQQFFGADAAKTIVAHFLGPYEAGQFNGNGNPLRYIPTSHPPLLDYTDMTASWLPLASAYGAELTAGSLQTQSGFFFEPPYKSDGLGWINKFAEDDFCVFFYGYIDRDTQDWPCPVYARYEEYLKTARVHKIDGDVMNTINIETRPENNINRVLVWGNPFNTTPIPLTPAFIQGEAPNPTDRWERTQIFENNLAATPLQASILAFIILNEIVEEDGLFWPRYNSRGRGEIQVGDLVWTEDSRNLNVNNTYYRAGRVQHAYLANENDGISWNTEMALQTLSDTQLQAFYDSHPGFLTP